MRLPENNGDFEYLQDEIVSLAEDIIELDERTEEIDNHQIAILHLMTEMSKVMSDSADILAEEAELVKDLEGKFDFHDKTILILFIIFLVWNLVLTYNVFF